MEHAEIVQQRVARLVLVGSTPTMRRGADRPGVQRLIRQRGCAAPPGADWPRALHRSSRRLHGAERTQPACSEVLVGRGRGCCSATQRDCCRADVTTRPTPHGAGQSRLAAALVRGPVPRHPELGHVPGGQPADHGRVVDGLPLRAPQPDRHQQRVRFSAVARQSRSSRPLTRRPARADGTPARVPAPA